MKGYRYCRIHEYYYFFFSDISKCDLCVKERQARYDQNNCVISDGDKRRCNKCRRFTYGVLNYTANKMGVRGQFCDKCLEKIKKSELIIRIEKLINKIDGKHHSGTKNRTF